MRMTKWWMLSGCCLLMFGDWYVYDIPASCQQLLRSFLMPALPQESEFNWYLNAWYSAYSLPNVVLPAIGGLLMDVWGLRSMVVLLSWLVLAGQVVFSLCVCWAAVATSAGSAQLALFGTLLGRFVFGLGGESLGVAQSTLVSRWFFSYAESSLDSRRSAPSSVSSSSLTLAMGMTLAIGRLGSVLNDFVSPRLATAFGMPVALLVGTGMCLLSLAGAYAVIRMDRHYSHDSEDKQGQQNPGLGGEDSAQVVLTAHGTHSTPAVDVDASPSTASTDVPVQAVSDAAWDADLSRSSMETTSLTSRLSRTSTAPISPRGAVSSWSVTGSPLLSRVLSLAVEMRQLPLAYWVMCGVLIFTYGTVIPFNAIHAGFLQYRFHMSPVHAAEIMAIPDTLSTLLTPFTGSVVDRIGRRSSILMLCSLLLTSVHLTLGWWNGGRVTPQPAIIIPYLPLALLGVCYAFLLIFWPMVPLLVPQHLCASAYGLLSSIFNLGLTIYPLIVSALLNADPSYAAVETLFVISGCLAFMGALLLFFIDRWYCDGVLERGPSQQWQPVPDEAAGMEME